MEHAFRPHAVFFAIALIIAACAPDRPNANYPATGGTGWREALQHASPTSAIAILRGLSTSELTLALVADYAAATAGGFTEDLRLEALDELVRRRAFASIAEVVDCREWDGGHAYALRNAVLSCGREIAPFLAPLKSEFAKDLLVEVRRGSKPDLPSPR